MGSAKRIERFAAVDGSEFDTAAEADSHSELTRVAEEFKSAERAYVKAICERQKTADGYDFRLGYQAYHQIVGGYFNMPTVVEVRFNPHRCEVGDRDQFEVVLIDYDSGERTRVDVGSLYRYRKNAIRRCAELMRAQLEGFEEKVKDLELLSAET